jgi:predicted ATPase
LIKSLHIENLKRFQNTTIRFGALTVLTGLNGSGKSTVVQALLLAHQASISSESTVPLVDSTGLNLGTAAEILNYDARDSYIRIGIESEGMSEWILDVGNAGENEVPYVKKYLSPDISPEPIGHRGASFTYLSAERMGPRVTHPISPANPDESVVGSDGRYVAHALAVEERREVDAKRRFPFDEAKTMLLSQVEAWLSSLVGNTQIRSTLSPRTGIATLEIRNPRAALQWLLPTNTGFGVSYCLPVIVAGLLIPVGGILIVDSPEAHLHPAAQSAMGVFLATVAASGVQVVVETHSDHVLNGFRKAVGSGRSIDNEDVEIVFFGEYEEPERLTINERGSLNQWPHGFFDQYELDLDEIIRHGRPTEG